MAMDHAKLIQRLMATFLGEMEDHATAMSGDLIKWEKATEPSARAELIKTLFRSAHSLKGAARAVNLRDVEAVCHRMEEIFSAARDGSQEISPHNLELLLLCVDGLQSVSRRLQGQMPFPEEELGPVLARLDGKAPRTATAPAPPRALVGPPAAEPPEFRPRPVSLAPPPAPREVNLAALPPVLGPRASMPPRRLTLPPPPPVEPARPEPGPPEPPPAAAPTPQIRRTLRPTSARPPAPAPPPAAPVGRAPAGVDLSVRVAAAKLDGLMLSSREFVLAQHRSDEWRSIVDGLREGLATLETDWQAIQRPLTEIVQLHAGESPRIRAANAMVRRMPPALLRLRKDGDRLAATIIQDGRALALSATHLNEAVQRLGMVPMAEACAGMERAVRDVARQTGIEVELTLEGEDVELDRAIVERLRDPLLHLVRNSVAHGIEQPNERRRLGKPRVGRIIVRAELQGAAVEITVSDDGKGLDAAAIRRQAVLRGLPAPTSDRDIGRMIFDPGFSTAENLTEVSGRGVGLDVVRSRVEAMHGNVDVVSDPGKGTRFQLVVPLTLARLRALVVRAGGELLALPIPNVRRVLRVRPDDIQVIEGRPTLVFEGRPIEVANLGATLGLRQNEPERALIPVVVVSALERDIALSVDALEKENEFVIQRLGARMRQVQHIAGAIALPGGGIALVLNVSEVIRTAVGLKTSGHATGEVSDARPRNRLIVADDALTTRTLVKTVLEAAGYSIVTAFDGEEAWRILNADGADLLVTDGDMPRMDGFTLTEQIRASKRFQSLPVVIVSGMERDQDRARGAAAGADAYITKSGFDQSELLATIERLIGSG